MYFKTANILFPFQNVQKLSEGERKTAHQVDWPQWSMYLSVKPNVENFLNFQNREQNRNALEVSLK